MAAGVSFRAVTPGAGMGATDPHQLGELVGTVSWPSEFAPQGLEFFVENLLTERVGTPEKAWALMQRGYAGRWPRHSPPVGAVLASERARFLSERAFFPPLPDEALASAVDLEDVVALFSTLLRQIRHLPPELDVVMIAF